MSEKEQLFLDKIDERFKKQDERLRRTKGFFYSIIGVLVFVCLMLGFTQIVAVSQNTLRSKANKDKIEYTVPSGTFELTSELYSLQIGTILSKISIEDDEFNQLMKDFYMLRRAIMANINTTRGASQ